ncbi:MAG: glucose 1-dehydrogenase [Flavobacteriaceae bacterium]|nr:glucose 1-dehydrogenase [Flavobacteriaceae bacterium]
MKKINLTDQNALVTGGSQGIGAAICRHFAAAGANVFINYNRSKEKAELLAKEIMKNHNVKTAYGKGDVANRKEVRNMFRQMDKEFGGIDILVNNAGCETVNHVLDMDEEEWDKVLDVNLKGPFLCSKQAAYRMENKGGVIINISSIHDFVPRKGLIHYCSAKAGLKMFSKCLSLELADKNIRVISIAPGTIETNINRKEIEKFGRGNFERWIPQGRLGNVNDVANTVTFMASDLASYVNGSDIYIDGSYMNSTIQYDPRLERKKH